MIANFSLNETDWTPILAPFDCNYYAILTANGGPWPYRCSDPSDPGTSYLMGGGYDLFVPHCNRARFLAGNVVTYLKSSSGNVRVAIEFIEEWKVTLG
jgi:hypothetical protein